MKKDRIADVYVGDLKPGDEVDLEGDEYADPGRDDPAYECEYQPVEEVVQETPDCVVVFFATSAPVGFPPEHKVRVRIQDL